MRQLLETFDGCVTPTEPTQYAVIYNYYYYYYYLAITRVIPRLILAFFLCKDSKEKADKLETQNDKCIVTKLKIIEFLSKKLF